ncbi:hypothetical protein HMPREF1548_06037, partial [Clostridium sp. KLE 1755]
PPAKPVVLTIPAGKGMGAGKGFLCVVLPERKRPAATALRKSRQQRAPKSASHGGKRKYSLIKTGDRPPCFDKSRRRIPL